MTYLVRSNYPRYWKDEVWGVSEYGDQLLFVNPKCRIGHFAKSNRSRQMLERGESPSAVVQHLS